MNISYKISNYHQLLQRSIQLYCASFSQVFFIALLFSLLVFLPNLLTALFGHPTTGGALILNTNLLIAFLINLVALIIFIALLWQIDCIKKGKPASFLKDFSMGLHKILPAIAASFIQNLIISAITIIIFGLQLLLMKYIPTGHVDKQLYSAIAYLFVPFFLSIYLSTLFIFLIPIIAIENISFIDAIKKAVTLVWNHWWRVFSLQITPWIVYFLVLYFIKKALHINVDVLFNNVNNQALLTSILYLIIFAVFIPWTASLLIVQLEDLEKRYQERILKKND